MQFYKNLYWSESITGNRKKICWKLKHNAGQLRIYVITLAKGRNQLEIFHCAYLQQKYYKKNPPFIIGITDSYEEAMLLLQKITQEIFEKTGNVNFKNYFLSCL